MEEEGLSNGFMDTRRLLMGWAVQVYKFLNKENASKKTRSSSDSFTFLKRKVLPANLRAAV
ncbi:hypothetical protein H2202_007857 [Exophiala xenobiotica]|nr:hypothetical protein H2202_007857 [Exophiala xenobiotica]